MLDQHSHESNEENDAEQTMLCQMKVSIGAFMFFVQMLLALCLEPESENAQKKGNALAQKSIEGCVKSKA